AGMRNAVFIKSDGTVWTVGYNSYGQFGNGLISVGFSDSAYKVPEQMKGVSNAVRVAVGKFTTCILLKDGTVMAVGGNNYGGLGKSNNELRRSLEPIYIQGLNSIVDIKASAHFCIALDSIGDVYSWGRNDGYGALGTGKKYISGSENYSPVQKVKIISNIIAISACADGYHFMALDQDSNAYMWGVNEFGINGAISEENSVDTPVLIATGVVDIMAGETFSYIIKSDKTVWCNGQSNHFLGNVGSIWMDMPDIRIYDYEFHKVNPLISPMNLCMPEP